MRPRDIRQGSRGGHITMLDERVRRREGSDGSRRPTVVWWVLTGLYLVAAVLSLQLAAAMISWWPLVLVTGSVVAAAACVLAARARGRTRDPRRARGSPHVEGLFEGGGDVNGVVRAGEGDGP